MDKTLIYLPPVSNTAHKYTLPMVCKTHPHDWINRDEPFKKNAKIILERLRKQLNSVGWFTVWFWVSLLVTLCWALLLWFCWCGLEGVRKLKLKANLRFFSLPYKRQFYLRWEPEQATEQGKRGSGSGLGGSQLSGDVECHTGRGRERGRCVGVTA